MLQREVVFINEHTNLQTRLLESSRDDGIEAVGKLGGRFGHNVIFLLVFAKADIEIRNDAVCRSSSTAHIKTDNGILLPVILKVHDLQTIKEFSTPLKI